MSAPVRALRDPFVNQIPLSWRQTASGVRWGHADFRILRRQTRHQQTFSRTTRTHNHTRIAFAKQAITRIQAQLRLAFALIH